MKARIGLLLLLGTISTAVPAGTPGVRDEARARQNWILQCQGCHRPSATGTTDSTPPLAGFVARFLSVSGGREYLARVPGVATAAVSDRDLAELLNWTLYRYDGAHVPAGFKPYTPEEVGRWRHKPLRTEASSVRRSLVAVMPRDQHAR
jgi:cytochrome c553